MLHGESEATVVTVRQQLIFSMRAAAPDGADGMDYPLRGQVVRLRDARFACRAAAERPAFREQFRPRRAMDRAIHAATAEQRSVRRVDDRRPRAAW